MEAQPSAAAKKRARPVVKGSRPNRSRTRRNDRIKNAKSSDKKAVDATVTVSLSKNVELQRQRILDSQRAYREKYGKLYDSSSDEEDGETRGKATRCTVCLERCAADTPVWQCVECWGVLHLSCIQKWAQANKNADGQWTCPRCRIDYDRKQYPEHYFCFCGKVRDPPQSLWSGEPHTCNQLCERKRACGHTCTQLCHSGACVQCPQTVEADCFCMAETRMVRCGDTKWSCGNACSARLDCGEHFCQRVCHDGECGTCPERVQRACVCGKETQRRPCAERSYQCGAKCNKPLECGKHRCQRSCHDNECGTCPRSGPRPCPCGKVTSVVPCDRNVPVCGGTCEKLLGCNEHRCGERCHYGECSPCLLLVQKRCSCGAVSRKVACSQPLKCQRKCMNMRNCGRHQCKAKCCDNACQPCSETCGRKLDCGNCACESKCHAGACLPCHKRCEMRCYCKKTVISVACAVFKTTKPPQCNELCRRPPSCHHASREPHRCHFGLCEPCAQTCDKVHEDCGHHCFLPCHDPLPTLPAPSRRVKRPPIPDPTPLPLEEVECPPCAVIVQRACRGEHEVFDVECATDPSFSCERACNNLLACGNHHCTLPCHVITHPRELCEDESGVHVRYAEETVDADDDNVDVDDSSAATTATTTNSADTVATDEGEQATDWDDGVDACEECVRECAIPRDPPCPHSCPMGCHVGVCEPCDVLVHRSCHCKSIKIQFECHVLSEIVRLRRMETRLSCGQQCPRILPFCTHRCPAPCHSGVCVDPTRCAAKVKVRCSCERKRRQTLACSDAQLLRERSGAPKTEMRILECDEECRAFKEERERASEAKRERAHTYDEVAKQDNALTTGSKTKKKKKRNVAVAVTAAAKHKYKRRSCLSRLVDPCRPYFTCHCVGSTLLAIFFALLAYIFAKLTWGV